VDITQTVMSALCHLEHLILLGDIADHFFGVSIPDHGTEWNLNIDILATLTGALTAHAVLATLGAVGFGKTKIGEGIQALLTDKVNTATIPTVATIRATLGDVLLTAKADAAITTVTGFHLDVCFIDEFHYSRLE
jgi:hypothetical protein